VPERIANTVKPGNAVSFALQSDVDGGEYQAVVTATEPVITPSSRTLLARAIFTNTDRKIRAGSFATVRLSLGGAEPVPTVPEQALIGSAEGYHVFVVVDGRAERRTVTSGVRRGERVAIDSGLDASEPVIIAGQQRLQDGIPVKIVQVQD
jgi:membrane fusion protein (multidrug efflux system)